MTLSWVMALLLSPLYDAAMTEDLDRWLVTRRSSSAVGASDDGPSTLRKEAVVSGTRVVESEAMFSRCKLTSVGSPRRYRIGLPDADPEPRCTGMCYQVVRPHHPSSARVVGRSVFT